MHQVDFKSRLLKCKRQGYLTTSVKNPKKMASPKTRRALAELRPKDENDVSFSKFRQIDKNRINIHFTKICEKFRIFEFENYFKISSNFKFRINVYNFDEIFRQIDIKLCK